MLITLSRRPQTNTCGWVMLHPFWSLTVLTLDVLVIYRLAAYGSRPTFD
jgi:hypothetical protein